MKKKKEKGRPRMGMASIIIDGMGSMGGVATIIVVGSSWLTLSLVLVTIFKIISFKTKKKKKTEKKNKSASHGWRAGVIVVARVDRYYF